ncbi:MAG: hypothetical protein AAGH79_04115 [Bacteroidota bacterium]
MKRIKILLVLLAAVPSMLAAQADNLLRNPSFEYGASAPGILPAKWFSCGDLGNSPPDLHNDLRKHFFEIEADASDGIQFVSMVSRADGTTECLGQKLKKPLLAGETYQLTIHLSQDPYFTAHVKNKANPVPFDKPVVVEVYIKMASGEVRLLGDTQAIDHAEWRAYQFVFTPDEPVTEVRIGPYFSIQYFESYYGHVLLDEVVLEKVSSFAKE